MINISILASTIIGIIFGLTLRTLKLSTTFGMSLTLPLCFVLKPETILFMLIAIYLGGISFEKREWHHTRAIAPFLKSIKLIDYNTEKMKMRLTGFCIFSVAILFLSIVLLLRKYAVDKVQFLALCVFCIVSAVCFNSYDIPSVSPDKRIKSRFLSLLLSLISAVIGLMIPTIGIDTKTGAQRYSMGIAELYGGIDFIIVVLGLCCFGEILYAVSKPSSREECKFNDTIPDNGIKLELINTCKPADFLSAIVLGIPFSQASAIITGIFALYGISYSQALPIISGAFAPEPDNLNFSIFAYIFIVFVFIVSQVKINASKKRVSEKIRELLSPVAFYPIFAVTAFVGAYSINYRIFDMFLLIIFGLLGFTMRRLYIPITPLIICAAFGSRIEESYRTPFSWSILTVLFYLLSAIILVIYIKKAFEPDSDRSSSTGFNDIRD